MGRSRAAGLSEAIPPRLAMRTAVHAVTRHPDVIHMARCRARPRLALALATIAFAVCFYAWRLLGPLATDLKTAVGLSDLETSTMVAVPVLLGLGAARPARMAHGPLRPHGRYGERRVFSALTAFSSLALAPDAPPARPASQDPGTVFRARGASDRARRTRPFADAKGRTHGRCHNDSHPRARGRA